MIFILRAVGIALLLALSGCSMAAMGLRVLARLDNTPSVVLKVETHKPSHSASALSGQPTFLLLDDGRFIAIGGGAQDGVQPYLVWQLSEDGVGAVIELAIDAGMMTDSSTFGDLHPRSRVFGILPTIFTLNVDDEQYTQRIWSIGNKIVFGPDDPRTQWREGLTEFYNKLRDISSWLEPDMAEGPRPFEADRSLLFLTYHRHDPDSGSQIYEFKDWPLEPLSAMTRMDEAGHTKCLTASSSTVEDINQQTYVYIHDEKGRGRVTRFISEGQRLSPAHTRPLMPDESGCGDA